MSRRGASVALAACALVACEGPSPAGGGGTGPDAAVTGGTGAPVALAPTGSRAEPPAPVRHGTDALADELALARILSLAPPPQPAPQELYIGMAALPGETAPQRIRVTLALRYAPRAHRPALAYYALARALGSEVVPPIVQRRVVAADLRALFGKERDEYEFVKARGSIQNDGTLDATIAPMMRSPSGREILVDRSAEVSVWARWAASPKPVAHEDARLLKGYVEMLVLDYLSGNAARALVWLDRQNSLLRLVDNASAFPNKIETRMLERVLGRLRAVTRFPREMRENLERFDRARAWATFAPGDFETWLLPPRTAIELDERRVGVLTLIDARIAEHGAAAVLSL